MFIVILRLRNLIQRPLGDPFSKQPTIVLTRGLRILNPKVSFSKTSLDIKRYRVQLTHLEQAKTLLKILHRFSIKPLASRVGSGS